MPNWSEKISIKKSLKIKSNKIIKSVHKKRNKKWDENILAFVSSSSDESFFTSELNKLRPTNEERGTTQKNVNEYSANSFCGIRNKYKGRRKYPSPFKKKSVSPM